MGLLLDMIGDALELTKRPPEADYIYDDFLKLCAPSTYVNAATGELGLGMGSYRE